MSEIKNCWNCKYSSLFVRESPCSKCVNIPSEWAPRKIDIETQKAFEERIGEIENDSD